MGLEAQLILIIEQQQAQLKQQQTQQESALLRLEAQTETIAQFKSYSSKLATYSEILSEKNKEQELIIQKLRNPQLSEILLMKLESGLQEQLQSHLKQLVNGLDIAKQAEQILTQSLPNLVKAEIEKQTVPMTEKIKKKLDSVQQYHEKFEDLVQQLSSRL